MDPSAAVDLGVVGLREALTGRTVSSTEVVSACLDRIEAMQESLNAFVVWDRRAALEQSRELDERLARGETPGLLHGIPVAVKDNYVTAGLPTTAGSRAPHPALGGRREASLVTALRAEGAVVIGKTTMHEWAYGATNLLSANGSTANPWDLTRITGGSSGGSGSALAARMIPLALGTDTGGSVRIPAASCGITGLKPTYGRLPMDGVLPLAWSFDVAGPMARSAEDLLWVLRVLAPRRRAARVGTPDGLRFGLLEGPGMEASAEVDAAVAKAVAELLPGTGKAEAARLDLVPEAFGAWKVILHCEAACFHADVVDQAGDCYAPGVRAQIEAGRQIFAVDYLTAQRFRREFTQTVLRLLDHVDVLLLPTVPVVAPPADAHHVQVGSRRSTVQDAMTCLAFLANFTGLPAVSLPCGFGSSGLPVGLTLLGRPGEDETLLAAARSYQEKTDWHLRRPALIP